MSFADDDFQTMAKGPLGVYADGPDGRVWGFLDRATEDNWRISEFGRAETRLDLHVVFKIGTATLGTIDRDQFVTFPDQPNHRGTVRYRVLDFGLTGDAVVTALYLARAPAA